MPNCGWCFIRTLVEEVGFERAYDNVSEDQAKFLDACLSHSHPEFS
jgi:hypothetical protein